MDSKTQSINAIRYNANCILSTSRATTAHTWNYGYLCTLVQRLSEIENALVEVENFENEPVANVLSNSIHKTMLALVPSYGLGDFDWDGVGEDLAIIVGNAAYILEACDEFGLAQSIHDKYNLFVTMCEIQEKLDEQQLTDLAND